ncbi:MAG: nickel-responsive transcriptional regulator NikR, partial [Candidatus Altiarchaeota archaeon]|nr:nickel-responsive transcriptional regulator NikR [Candidatus Altiarchaeota archaeon]
MDRVTRFGVSLPSRLVDRFDRTLLEIGYESRSKAIADAVTDFIAQNRWKAQAGLFVGSITYVYDHHVGDVTRTLTGAQHDYGSVIKAVMHSHVSHSECVEVLIVSGSGKKVIQLYNNLSSIRGVENCKL